MLSEGAGDATETFGLLFARLGVEMPVSRVSDNSNVKEFPINEEDLNVALPLLVVVFASSRVARVMCQFVSSFVGSHCGVAVRLMERGTG